MHKYSHNNGFHSRTRVMILTPKERIEYTGLWFAYGLGFLMTMIMVYGCFVSPNHTFTLWMNGIGEAYWEGWLFVGVAVVLMYSATRNFKLKKSLY
jgi:hypothetical protein